MNETFGLNLPNFQTNNPTFIANANPQASNQIPGLILQNGSNQDIISNELRSKYIIELESDNQELMEQAEYFYHENQELERKIRKFDEISQINHEECLEITALIDSQIIQLKEQKEEIKRLKEDNNDLIEKNRRLQRFNENINRLFLVLVQQKMQLSNRIQQLENNQAQMENNLAQMENNQAQNYQEVVVRMEEINRLNLDLNHRYQDIYHRLQVERNKGIAILIWERTYTGLSLMNTEFHRFNLGDAVDNIAFSLPGGWFFGGTFRHCRLQYQTIKNIFI